MEEANLGVMMGRPSPLPFMGVSKRKRSVFYTQLARMLNAGISPVRTLNTLAEQRSSWRLSRAARDMAAHIQSGATLAEAFARHPNLFPENEVRMIEASEHGGAAPDTMLRIAHVLDLLTTFWLRFVTGLIYPAIMVLAALVCLPLLIAVFLGHPVAVLCAQLRVGAVLVVAVLVATTLWRSLASLSAPRVVLDGVLLQIPIFGGLARRMATARFADTVQCLYAAGVRLPEAVGRAALACGNAALGRRLLQCAPLVQQGMSLTQALAQSGAIPALGLNMIEVGEMSGKLDESLSKFSQYQQQDAEITIDRLAKVLPLVVYGAVMIFMVLQILQAAAGYVGTIEKQLH